MDIDQCQNQLHLTNKQVIPNKVTCNPTDDTARDDELLSSSAYYHFTSNHGAHYYHNQNSIHHNHFAFYTCGAKHSTNCDNPSHQIQNRFNYCSSLPQLENNHNNFGSPKIHAPLDHYSRHVYPQTHFVNKSINHSSDHQAEQSLQSE